MFLTYQKYCLEKFSGKTCVAAYGDGFIGYVPEDSDFALGGYEITGAFQLLKPGCEKLIKSEIDKIEIDISALDISDGYKVDIIQIFEYSEKF